MNRPEPVIIRRFTRGDEEWAVMDNGHYRVLRAGDLAPGVAVTTKDRRCSHRMDYVTSLFPGWHGAVTVAVRWEKQKGARTPGPFWRKDELRTLERRR